MKKIILETQLDEITDGRSFINNLESVVRDISSTPFANEDLKLYHDNKEVSKYFVPDTYNIFYGSNSDDKDIEESWTLDKNAVWKSNVDITTLKDLKFNLYKAKNLKNPDFKIQYNKDVNDKPANLFEAVANYIVPSIKPKGSLHRLKRIEFFDSDYDIALSFKIKNSGLVRVKFEYHKSDSLSKMPMIEKTQRMLLEKGYNKVN